MEELNLYLLTSNRKKDVIFSFLNEIAQKEAIRLLNDEVMVVPREYIGDLEQINDYEWIVVNSIDDVIGLGVSDPSRAFSCYFSIDNNKITGIILSFTIDNYLIMGVTLANTQPNYKYSQELLRELFMKYDGILGGIFIEQCPALSKDLFIKYLRERSLFRL